MNEQRIDEQLNYLGQMLNDDVARVIVDAMQRYSVTTLGRDRAIADDIARLFEVHA